MEYDPKEGIVFKNVDVNKVYSKSLRLLNPLNIAVQFTLSISNSRFSIEPKKLQLKSGESSTVSVCFVTDSTEDTKDSNALVDSLRLKSAFFEQNIPITIYFRKLGEQDGVFSFNLEEPSEGTLLQNQIALERQKFEESSFKALSILKQKDETISNLQKMLEQERLSHLTTKEQLLQAHTDQNAKRSIPVDNESTQDLIQENAQLALESQQLRERCLDQSEQIQALVYEISKLRDASHSSVPLSRNRTMPSGNSNEGKTKSNDREVEVSVEGDLHTSTPLTFGVAASSPSPDEAIAIQGRLLEALDEISRLKEIIMTNESKNRHLQESLDRYKTVCADIASDRDRLQSENEKLHRRIEVLQAAAEAVSEEATLQGKANRKETSSLAQAHTWWSYVWHECRRLGRERELSSQLLMQPGETGAQSSEGAISRQQKQQVDKMSELLRAQAVDLATTRQECLRQQLQHRQEVDSLVIETEQLRQECVKLKNRLRLQQNDKETKIAEMAATIRSLSSRSVLHAQLSEARQDCEAEKLVSSHLRFELEEYRSLLEAAEQKAITLRRENLSLQGTIDNLAVLRTVLSPAQWTDGSLPQSTDPHAVMNSPNPSALIEVMSGEMQRLEKSLLEKETELNDCKVHVASLEVIMGKYRQQILAAKQSQISKRSEKSNGPDKARRSVHSSEQENAADENKSNTEPFDDLQESQDLSILATQQRRSVTAKEIAPLSIVVDRDSSPQMVLDRLDAAVLRERLVMQEAVIEDLQEQLRGGRGQTSGIAPEEVAALLRDGQKELAALREDCVANQRLRRLTQSQLEDTKAELNSFKEDNIRLQKELLSAISKERRSEISATRSVISNRAFASLDNDGDENDCQAEECKKVKHMLQERTAQLQVAMDTLDALNSADVHATPPSAPPDALGGLGFEGAEDLFRLAAQPGAVLGPSPSSRSGQRTLQGSAAVWGYQLLVQRIVQMTADLCSQTASLRMEERRNKDLQTDNLEKTKALNLVKFQLKEQSALSDHLQEQLERLLADTEISEKDYIRKVNEIRTENSDLSNSLRELQNQFTVQAILLQQSNEALKLTELAVVEKWFDGIIGAVQEGKQMDVRESNRPTNTAENDGSPELTSIQDLLSQLLATWKVDVQVDQEGHSQRILQRVVDMVLSCNKIATSATIRQINAENEAQKSIASQKALEDMSKALALRLLQTRRRSSIGERIILTQLATSPSSPLEGVLRQALIQMRADRDSLARITNKYRREKRLKEKAKEREGSLLEQKITLLQQQIALAEKEAKGSTSLRAREEASQSMEGRISESERTLKKWMKVEVPRIVTGLPLTEDVATESNVHEMITAAGLEKTFALSQALCAAKASEAMQAVKISSLQDRISLLKERNIELEGVLLRWGDEVNHAAQLFRTASQDKVQEQEIPQTLFEDDWDRRNTFCEKSLVNEGVDTQVATEKFHAFSDRVTELQLEISKQKDEIDRLSSSRDNFKEMTEALLEDESSLKVSSTRQITRIRGDLEAAHSDEIRRLRFAYEEERKALLEELRDIGRAVEDAHVLTAPNKSNSSSSMTSSGDSIAILDDADGVAAKSRVFNSSIQEHIEAIENEFKSSASANRSGDSDMEIFSSKKGFADLNASSNRFFRRSQSERIPIVMDRQTGTEDLFTFRSIGIETDKSLSSVEEKGKDRQGQDEADGPGGSDGNTSDSSESIKDIFFDDLERLLAIERRKNEESRSEVQELESLLAIQKMAFEQHLDGAVDQHFSSGERVPSQSVGTCTEIEGEVMSKAAAKSASTQTVHVPSSLLDPFLGSVNEEVTKEDRDLWPSAADLLTEMVMMIRSSQAHLRSGRNDVAVTVLQGALAMGARLRVLLLSETRERWDESRGGLRGSGRVADPHASGSFNDSSFSGDLRSLNERLQNMVSDYRLLSSMEQLDTGTVRDRVVERETQTSPYDFPSRLPAGYTDTPSVGEEDLEVVRRRIRDLERQLQVANDNKLESQVEHDRLVSSIRRSYEAALSEANAALESATTTAKQEIDRLAAANAQLRLSQNPRPRLTPMAPDEDAESSLSGSAFEEETKKKENEALEEELSQLRTELARSRDLLKWNSANHVAELQALSSHFHSFRAVQDEIVSALEHQILDLSVSGLPSGWADEAEQQLEMGSFLPLLSLEDAEEKLTKLATLFKLNKMKLRTIMNAISRFDSETSTRLGLGSDFLDTASGSSSTLEYPNITVQPLYPPLYQTRMSAATAAAAAASFPPPSPSLQPLREQRQDRGTRPKGSRRRSKSADSVDRVATASRRPQSTSNSPRQSPSLLPQPSPFPSPSPRTELPAARTQLLPLPISPSPARDQLRQQEQGLDIRDREEKDQERGRYEGLRQEMLIARLAAAERRIDFLQSDLLKERQIGAQLRSERAAMQTQVQLQARDLANAAAEQQRRSLQSRSDGKLPFRFGSTTTVPLNSEEQLLRDADRFLKALEPPFDTAVDIDEAGRAPHIADKLRRLGQAANELREHASGYIHSLLQLLSRYQEREVQEYGEELRARDQNLERSRSRDREMDRVGRSSSPRPSEGIKVAEGKDKEKDSRDKEELARKSKLLAAMKVARTADLNALQQWKAEAARLDDNCKRLQRAVEAKDSLLKDLRTKLSLDEQKSKEKEVIGTDVASLSAAELRNRLRASELERARGRTRLQVLKEKIVELEASVTQLQTENERLKRAAGALGELRLTVARKDEVIAGLRSQLERDKEELQQLKFMDDSQQADAQKKIRQLQRQLDALRREHEELEKEAALMRRRLLSAAPSVSTAAVTQPQPPSWVQRQPPPDRSAGQADPRPTASVLGSSLNLSGLGREATQDIQDVLSSLNLGFMGEPSMARGREERKGQGPVEGIREEEGEGDDQGDEESSIEKRLKALVGAALRSPVRGSAGRY